VCDLLLRIELALSDRVLGGYQCQCHDRKSIAQVMILIEKIQDRHYVVGKKLMPNPIVLSQLRYSELGAVLSEAIS